MSYGGQTPTVVVLKEGTDTSQGRGQILSNIDACLAIQDTLKPTLGPFGSDVLIVDGGKTTISNDGATILRLLDVIHPAAKILVDVSRSQDAEVGDGTTSVTLLAAEFLKEARQFVEEGMSSSVIVKAYRSACRLACGRVRELQIELKRKSNDTKDDAEFRELLKKCAKTTMASKLIQSNSDFFADMVVEAVQCLDQDELDENLIGMKKIAGGSLEESRLVKGVAFKKTFSYAGFEQQPKKLSNPKILCLNVELELKAEKDNAEVRINKVNEYQAIVDAEWKLILQKLEAIVATGAQIVLSKLPIGDLATQYFADRGIFCAGRIPADDMERTVSAVGGSVQSTCSELTSNDLGNCGSFEEIQIGSERYNLFEGCPKAKTCTFILRGGAEQVIAEVDRSLHDAIMIVKRAIQNNYIVAGGGAIEMELSKYLRDLSRQIDGKQQLIVAAYARALEVIPRQLCENAGLDGTELINKLRSLHSQGETWYGLDFGHESVANNMDTFVWEPSLTKINALQSATEAAALVLSVDETIKSEPNHNSIGNQPVPPPAGRGRGVPQGMPPTQMQMS
ncbi:T-complex protein 1 subunit eta [Brettanomyces nanus]|uniref:T-complex protein 1 subunit eta n=1 Tax=Eeniella nana TaxID=13502 RepID=A0A875RX33_EENNA|nr:T-complex protein 1 subunit eta [Brettanomyces nanus]QPG73556.1 T-complex protein 1 subunit eta [Brettanomyces nanus]